MSLVSTIHDIIPFVAGKTAPFTGQRLAKIGYKSTKKTPAKHKSVAVSVPKIDTPFTPEQVTELEPYILAMVQDAQDGVIRSLYESAHGTLKQVTDQDIDFAACVAWLAAEAAGDRLRKEDVTIWFDDEISDNLFVVIAEKLGFSEVNEAQTKVIDGHVRELRASIVTLSSGKSVFNLAQIRNSRSVLALASDSGDIGEKLCNRLDVMEKKVEKEPTFLL